MEKPPIISQEELAKQEPVAKGRSLRKRYILAAATIVCALLIAGVVAAVYLHMHGRTREFNIVVTSADSGHRERHQESIRVNQDKNFTEITVIEEDIRVLHDFKRGLGMLRIRNGSEHRCYLFPIVNRTAASPETFLKALSDHPDGEIMEREEEAHRFIDSPDNIEMRGFLGDEAQNMCVDVPMYWLIQENGHPAESIREKRRVADEQDPDTVHCCCCCHYHCVTYPCGCRHCWWVCHHCCHQLGPSELLT